jgi:hypothetical protein
MEDKTMDLTPDVNSQYGAPMGRPDSRADDRTTTDRISVRHLPLNSGGYDRGGAYWGLGQPMYGYQSADESIWGYLRASSRHEAVAQLKKQFPLAKIRA